MESNPTRSLPFPIPLSPRRPSDHWLKNPAYIGKTIIAPDLIWTDYVLDGGIDPPHFYYTDDEVRQALQAYGTHPLPQFGHPHPAPPVAPVAGHIEPQPVPAVTIPIDPVLLPSVQPSASGTNSYLSPIYSC
jgi:hypothetical protein